MQQKWDQNFDGEPMTDIPQKFLNAGCDVYMVMQLRHDEKIFDERFASISGLRFLILHRRQEYWNAISMKTISLCLGSNYSLNLSDGYRSWDNGCCINLIDRLLIQEKGGIKCIGSLKQNYGS